MKNIFLKFGGGGGDDKKDDSNQPQGNNASSSSSSGEPSAEELRRRRLERFQQMEIETAPPATTSPSQSPPMTSTTATTTVPTPTPSVNKPTPTTTTTPSSTFTNTKPITPIPTTTSSPKPAPTYTSSSSTTSSIKIRECDIPMSENDYFVLEKILLIYFKPTGEAKSCYLQSLSNELKNEVLTLPNKTLKLNADLLDRILVERLSDPSVNTPLVDYLLGCYNRIDETKRKNSRILPIDTKLLNELVELIIRYFGVVLTIPDMFPNSSSLANGKGPIQLIPYLKGEATTELSEEFLKTFMELYQDDKKQIFEPIILMMTGLLSKATLLSNFIPLFKAFSSIIQYKEVSDIFISLPAFNPNLDGAKIERFSLLGPYFSLSCISKTPDILEQYFKNASQMNNNNIGDAFTSIRAVLKTYHTYLYQMVRSFLKVSPASKEAFLVWICSVLTKNADRNKMRYDREVVSTNGFCLNLVAVMVMLCESFVDVSFSKVPMVDTNYLLNSPRHDISQETRLSSTTEDINQWKSQGLLNPTIPANFITECFFVTLRCIHVGINSTLNEIENYQRSIEHIDSEIKLLQSTKESWINTPNARMNEFQIDKLTKRLDIFKGILLCNFAQLYEPTFISKISYFLLFTVQWLTKIVNPNNQKVPLPLPAPPQFAALPEYCIEDVVNFFSDLTMNTPQYLESIPLEPMINFFVTILSTPELIKNPYLKAKIIQILSSFLPQRGYNQFSHLFECSELVKDNIVQALMKFFVEIEHTGRHNQFYEKFNYRFQSARILKFLWNNPFFQHKMIQECQKPESFLRFINMVINDSIYLLDESLLKLQEIRNMQILQTTDEWAQMSDDVRREKMETYNRYEGMVKSFLQLADSNLNMMGYISEKVTDPFVRPEIIERLSAMLNSYLAQLLGPKCVELKVREPEKYNFNPKQLLQQLTTIYSNLSIDERFVKSVVKDERNYKLSMFESAARILNREGLVSVDEMEKFQLFLKKLDKAAAEESKEEEDLGDIPDEYLCPIACTLMLDPVILPASRNTVDRASIQRHLLSDETDPFNRSRLTEDMLIPNTDLKNEITNWVKSKKNK